MNTKHIPTHIFTVDILNRLLKWLKMLVSRLLYILQFPLLTSTIVRIFIRYILYMYIHPTYKTHTIFYQ